MKLSFYGAAHEVTGSCYCLEVNAKKYLIDCGMQQGPDEYASQEMPFVPSEINAVFLTHAHIDHSGRIPLLAKLGFRGDIYATEATAELCSIMLRDSAHIQELEAEWQNRKKRRAGADQAEPMYSMKDAETALSLFRACVYNQTINVGDGVDITFIDVGHLLGSASIIVSVNEDGAAKKIVFSGDIGNINQPLIQDPSYITAGDIVVMESTYGDREHEPEPDYARALADVVQRVFDRGGNVVIPSFAVGRTQELLYFFRQIKSKGLVKGHDGFRVYVDSPLANEATNIFRENVAGYYDDEALALIQNGINPLSFDGLSISVGSDDSRAINFDQEPKVIISASGMCEAGRIRHHLKHNLWRPECAVIFVGFQAAGTLGRLLLDGVQQVKLFGETIKVNAEIVKLQGISGHADRTGLIKWISSFQPAPEKVFVVHGEESVAEGFAQLLREKLALNVDVPNHSSVYDLLSMQCLDNGIAVSPQRSKSLKDKRGSALYQRLLAACDRLMQVVHANREASNKDLAKFASQIDALSEKWKI